MPVTVGEEHAVGHRVEHRAYSRFTLGQRAHGGAELRLRGLQREPDAKHHGDEKQDDARRLELQQMVHLPAPLLLQLVHDVLDGHGEPPLLHEQ